jgi:ribonuclease P protein component
MTASLRLIRLKKRDDFLKAAGSGISCGTRSLVVQIRPNSHQSLELSESCACRVGFTATRKLGNAVIRNRAKRRMRAVADAVLSQYGRAGCDYVLIARTLCVQLPYDTLCKDLVYALKKVHAQC